MDRNTRGKKKDEIYKSKKHLGSGTFGRVEKVVSKVDQNVYALKLIENVQLIYLESIQAEAQAMMRAKSDYTVQLLNHFYDDEEGTYIFVMPYYSKGSLQDYLKQNTKWQKLDILCFLYQICQAFLSFSQQQGGCWHLDLKPDNILIKSEGQYSICDFGCAKLVDNINNSKFLQISMNRGGGTTMYAAPQIVLTYRGSKYSDIWSLGVILYKILYGKHPLQRPQKYPIVIKNFVNNKVAIDYPNLPGYQDIIDICKEMLQPEKRMDWDQLKKAIYTSIGLPLRTSIVVNIGKFISFAQNISKIVMGLVYYIQKNEKNLGKLGLTKDGDKLVRCCKLYVPMVYREVQRTIQIPQTKHESLFYLFPQIRKNYAIQQKQRLTHLKNVAQNFCSKQLLQKQNQNISLNNIKMQFQNNIDQFLFQYKKKNGQKILVQPSYQWEKIQKICLFIQKKNNQKYYRGLQFNDRNVIEKFSNQIVYE